MSSFYKDWLQDASIASSRQASSQQTSSMISPQRIIEVLERFKTDTSGPMPSRQYIYDLVGQYICYDSCPLAAMLGYTSNQLDLLGSIGCASLIHPNDLKNIAEHYQRFTTLIEPEVITVEYRMRRADGKWSWLRSQDTLFVQSIDGLPLQVLGIVQDITVSKQEESLLEVLAHIAEHASDVVIITDNQGVISYVNQTFEQVTGYSSAEVLGKAAAILKSGHHNIAFYRQLWNTLHAGQTFQAEFVNRRKNGELFHQLTTIMPIKDKQGMTHFACLGKDVTAQRHASEPLTNFALHCAD